MDRKERILKMLEEDKISSEEAVRLIEALGEESNTGNEHDDRKRADGKADERADDKDSRDKEGNAFNDLFQQFMGEVNKYVDKDKANDVYRDLNDRASSAFNNVKSKFDNQKQSTEKPSGQIFNAFDKVFDSVKNTNIESMFSQGPKNRLIETVDEEFTNVSLDITNGDIKIIPTDRVTTAKFEVSPMYRKLDKKKNYFQDIICEVRNGELIIVSDIRSAKVNVELQLNPETIKRLIISGSNGNVSIKEREFNDVTVDILNGDVTLDALSVSRSFIRTSRGHIKVKDGSYDNLELVTMVGTVNTENFNAKDVTVSANGSVNLALTKSMEYVTINTNMGSINVSVPKERELEGRLSTVLGQINYPPEIDVRAMKQQDFGLKEVMLVNDTDERGLFLEASTKFGSVTLHRR